MRFLILALCVAACLATKSYEGYKVLRMQGLTKEKVEHLRLLDGLSEINFWDFPRDLMVSPGKMQSVVEYLEAHDISFKVWMPDVQEKIDGVFTNRNIDVPGFNYFVYHTYDEIMAWVDSVVATYPTLASAQILGKTYEGRDQMMLKIGVDTGKTKDALYFHGGTHAREWVSPATVMWMTNAFLSNYTDGTDPDVTFIMESYDMYIVPVHNGDGYVFTWTDDRMWRKTRSLNSGSACIGTDPNRNYDYEWGGAGASPVPCSDTYHGESPLSEIEVANTVNFIRAQSATQTFRLFIDYHSYSQLMLSAWGYTMTLPADYDIMDAHMKAQVDAIISVYGTLYEYGAGAPTLYETSGGSKDWGYGDRGIPYSYTIELRDDGTYGFLLPEDQIYPTAYENYVGLIAGILHIASVTPPP